MEAGSRIRAGGVSYNLAVRYLPTTALRAGLSAIGLIAAAIVAVPPAGAQPACAPLAAWTVPGGGQIAAPELLARAARAQVVLLGEAHDNAEHHRWQLQTIAALSALRPKIVLGFEAFPRRVQGALDRWVAGELSEEEFLKASDWPRVWGYPAAFYLPMFHLARLNRMPMVALNVERDFVRDVGLKGLEGVPPDKREGVATPAPAREAYLERLFAYYAEHPEKKEVAPARSDPAFGRFVEAQLVWDRAMAQALAGAAARNPDALVIGIMGSGHVARGDGVPHQLEQLGVRNIVTLLPWDQNADCKTFSAGLATAVFGLPAAQPAPKPSRPLLRVTIESLPEGVRILTVNPGSIAEATGLRVGDVLIEAAGTAYKEAAELRALVLSMVPGTWLPLKARRQGEIVELTAKFPAKQ